MFTLAPARLVDASRFRGCLSASWKLPLKVRFKAQDRNGEWYEKEAEGLFAQAVCHELDHLDGHLFTEIVEEFVEVEDIK